MAQQHTYVEIDVETKHALKGIHEELREIRLKYFKDQRLSELQYLRAYREGNNSALRSIAASLDILANQSFKQTD